MTTEYQIAVDNPRHACREVSSVAQDGVALASSDTIVLVDDGDSHALRITSGRFLADMA